MHLCNRFKCYLSGDALHPNINFIGVASYVKKTGSLVFFAPLDCLNEYCAAECASGWLFCCTDCVCFARGEIFIWKVGLYWTNTMEGAALVEVRAGITFGVELYVPWDAPEVVVDIHSKGVVPLESIPDVVGLVGRRPDAAESRILQGRDVRSIRVLVPNLRGLEQNFHDVTIVGMGDVPESSVSLPSCRYSASSGPLRSLVTAGSGCSRIWI